MINKMNKYYVLMKHGNFCVEQLNEMSEYEMDVLYNEILNKLNK